MFTQAEQTFRDMDPVSRPSRKSNTNQTSRSEYAAGQADGTHSHAKLHRRHHHRFKQNSISSGTLSKHSHTVAHLIKSPTVHHSTKPDIPATKISIGTVRSSSMLDMDRPRSRKERTFVGGQCAVCELGLEHKLSGEKVLQFSCGHVAHEECFYEIMKDDDEQVCPTCDAPLALDSSRSGNVLDLNKLTSMVRSMPQAPGEMGPVIPSVSSAKTWDESLSRDRPGRFSSDSTRTHDSVVEDKDTLFSRIEKGAHNSTVHAATTISTRQPDEDSNQDSATARKHDYDLQAMEAKLMQIQSARDIPRPKVTIRSEFPTLTRSTQQQSLTCLVTVEVPSSRLRAKPLKGPHPQSAPLFSSESARELNAVADDLKARVEDWHGLEPDKFGPLCLHANLKVGRDGTNWQKLDCYLFSELLICVRERKAHQPTAPGHKYTCQLKGSILVKQHLKDIHYAPDDLILSLSLVVDSLPDFRLKFHSRDQLDIWRLALMRLDLLAPAAIETSDDHSTSGTEDEDRDNGSLSDTSSTHDDSKSVTTAATEDNDHAKEASLPLQGIHIPVDIVVVVPVSSSIQGLKIKLLKDSLRFIISQLGERDRIGLVTFGSNGGALPLVGMATKDWYGWREVYRSFKPAGQKDLRADSVEGANVALDLLSQRKHANPISSILLISDSATNEAESVDYVVQRAHAKKVAIYTFGLGQKHKPDNLLELSSKTNGAYSYVKDWMMLRECVAGCLGSLQSISHTAVKLKLKIPDGSTARIVKIQGALQMTKRTGGRDAEAALGDLRFGDKRDVLVQLSIDPDSSLSENRPQDHWESIVNGLTTLGGSLEEGESRPLSVEDIPIMQADLSFGDFSKEGAMMHLSHPSLLTIAMLPPSARSKRASRASIIPPIPSHPSIVQRRMEMLTSEMLQRALGLVTKNQSDSAHRLLAETRTILQGLGKGNLPPLPPIPAGASGHSRSSSAVRKEILGNSPRLSAKDGRSSPRIPFASSGRASPRLPDSNRSSNHSIGPLSENPSPPPTGPPPGPPPALPRAGTSIDPKVLHALDADIEACLEFIDQPAVFAHDAKKRALQSIGVISSQRGYTFRSESESLWAARIPSVRQLTDISKNWQVVGNDVLTEEMSD